jgi:hypothetical protein
MTTSLSNRKTNRATAGVAYASAAAAYLAAFVELAAHDAALQNSNIGGGPQLGFGEQPHVAGHGEFLRNIPDIANDIQGRVMARATVLINS